MGPKHSNSPGQTTVRPDAGLSPDTGLRRVVARLGVRAWLAAPGTRQVVAALTRDGDPALFVGGCVRDALLGRAVGDIDLATPLPPERVRVLLQQAGLRVIPTGLSHGTLTAMAGPPPWNSFEITTLRADVETDGRHARVRFAAGWTADARRRDFTCNALYCDLAGRVFDPVGGLADLRAGLVRFVGDPATRIVEDALRILRFFRFHGRFGRGPPDPASLTACQAGRKRLDRLSVERVADECLGILSLPNPLPVLRLMADTGILRRILPEAGSMTRLDRLVAIEAGLSQPPGPPDRRPKHRPGAIRRLAALVGADPEQPDRPGAGAALARRWHLSNRDRTRLAAADTHYTGPAPDRHAQRQWLFRHGAALYRDIVLLAWAGQDRAAATAETRPDASQPDATWREALALPDHWQPPAFPLRGRDLIAAGLSPGPELGRILADIQTWWIGADFRPDREACLARLAAMRTRS